MVQYNNLNNKIETNDHFKNGISMKYLINRTLCCILIQLLFACVFTAQTTCKYTSTNLNLREKPNTSGKILTVIPKWIQVQMDTDCNCKWVLVSYKGTFGYVSSKYLTCSIPKYYINSTGRRVPSPSCCKYPPVRATAMCWDNTYSFSENRRGTCSHHGGVKKWLR